MITTTSVVAAAFTLHAALHEATHLLAARASGVRVEEFVVGKGPALLSARLGGTFFSLRALPIFGGHVRISGMFDDRSRGSFGAQPPWRKAIIVAAGPLVNLVSAALLLLSGHLVAGAPAGEGFEAAVADLSRLTAGLAGGASAVLTGDGLLEATHETLRTVEGLGVASGQTGPYFGLAALVGLYFGLFNLLPVPPLDGGRLAFVVAEKLRGRPIGAQTAGRLILCGLLMISVLAVFTAYEDLVRLFS